MDHLVVREKMRRWQPLADADLYQLVHLDWRYIIHVASRLAQQEYSKVDLGTISADMADEAFKRTYGVDPHMLSSFADKSYNTINWPGAVITYVHDCRALGDMKSQTHVRVIPIPLPA